MTTFLALVTGSFGSCVALAFAATSAFADAPTTTDMTTEQCIASNADAQSLRRAGKFGEARQNLRLCLNASCPRMVKTDCVSRLEELDRVQPTVVFDTKDAMGGDLTEVSVSVDGHHLNGKLDGTALAVDPGLHSFRFEVAGQSPVVQTLVVKEGERARRVLVVFHPTAIASAPATVSPPSPAPNDRSDAAERPNPSLRKPLALGIAGVGLGALGVGAVFGLLASDAKSNYQKYCGAAVGAPFATSCTQPGVDGQKDASTKATISSISFIGGGVLAAIGGVLFFTAPDGTSASVGVGPDGVSLRGAF